MDLHSMMKKVEYPVLDHGYVKIIDVLGSDKSIVEAARMSTNKGFISWEPYKRCTDCQTVFELDASEGGTCVQTITNPDGRVVGSASQRGHHLEKFPNGDMGLLDNLWRNKHATPFEMCELVLEVQAPIMVFREWHRHRTQSYNEMSARYTQMPDLHYIPTEERIQLQSASNKQGSGASVGHDWANQIRCELERQQDDIYDHYDGWVEGGIAKEIARLNTPVSRYSRMRAKASLRNWLAFCNLRMRPGAQWEIRQYADRVGEAIKTLWPRTWMLFEEYDLHGATFSSTELQVLQALLKASIPEVMSASEQGAEISITREERIRMLIGPNLTGTKLKEFLKKLTDGGKTIL